MTALRTTYRDMRNQAKQFWAVNWTKTLYFNFKKFPFSTAIKLPVYFYGSVKFSSISGQIVLDAPVKKAMIGFGQPYEIITRSKGTAEICLKGAIVFKGHVQFGKDYFVYIDENARCEMGHMASLGGNGKIICYSHIVFGDYARIGFESQVMDSNFHQMIDTTTNEKLPMAGPIRIGNYNYLGNRISVMQHTITPDYCTVASNSVCNKDYTAFGNNVLIGGIPAKLLRENISRDWVNEKALLDQWLIV
jgi:acetyltransferase-like isoleucine patch superfamily enzyme